MGLHPSCNWLPPPLLYINRLILGFLYLSYTLSMKSRTFLILASSIYLTVINNFTTFLLLASSTSNSLGIDFLHLYLRQAEIRSSFPFYRYSGFKNRSDFSNPLVNVLTLKRISRLVSAFAFAQSELGSYSLNYCPANTIHWPNAGLMLGRRWRRRANINPAFGQCIVFAGWTLHQWWFNIRPPWPNNEPTLAQCLVCWDMTYLLLIKI